MKEFNTITEKEILILAYKALLDKVYEERKIAYENKKKHGKRSKVDLTQAWMYERQSDEILDRIIDLKLSENAQ